jgi:hypothetical protein
LLLNHHIYLCSTNLALKHSQLIYPLRQIIMHHMSHAPDVFGRQLSKQQPPRQQTAQLRWRLYGGTFASEQPAQPSDDTNATSFHNMPCSQEFCGVPGGLSESNRYYLAAKWPHKIHHTFSQIGAEWLPRSEQLRFQTKCWCGTCAFPC